ncbi:hypothetical protein [Thermanaerothrix sp.]|jgi:hypothetical protein|uniref:hypothetical protein n=1 Tax=Thermanaerothrix sp. TaxID=2972675 RepID=UPI002ADDB869|nr:hypothetical protein [Thermanaerothrix sp.]
MQKTNGKPKRKTLYLILAAFLIMSCICLAILGVQQDRVPTSQTIKGLLTSTVLTPSQSVSVLLTSAPSPTSSTIFLTASTITPSPRPVGLPSLQPTDIKVNLTEKGFTCTNAKESQAEGLGKWYVWYCDREVNNLISMHVEFMSYTLTSVDFIDATIIQYSEPQNDIASSFLGYIATFAFIGNEEAQHEARLWVEEKLGQLNEGCIEEIIRGIPFRLCGPPTGRFIEIGRMD